MSWLVTLRGETYSSLDLTLNEVEALETIAGQSWTVLNPFATVRAAKAYLAVFAMRQGLPDDEVATITGNLTLTEIRDSFVWVEDKPPAPPPRGKGKAAKAPKVDPTNAAPTSSNGVGGAPNVTTGRRRSPASKRSGT